MYEIYLNKFEKIKQRKLCPRAERFQVCVALNEYPSLETLCREVSLRSFDIFKI